VSAVDTPPPVEFQSCARCGAAVRADQDWCLNCGAAVTTTIAGPPGWRTPAAIAGVVAALAVIALVVAFLEISNDADQAAQAPTPSPTTAGEVIPSPSPSPSPTASPSPTPPPAVSPGTPLPGGTPSPAPSSSPVPSPPPGSSPAATPPAGAPTPAPAGGAIASWPAGKDGWTVVLASTDSKASADKRATELKGSGQNPGVLDSDQYSSLKPGFWVVFSGVYDTRAQAQKAAESAQSAAAGAYARQITPK